MQVTLRFPRHNLEGPNDRTPIKGAQRPPLGRSDGLGKTTNERPLKDKHLCLLTLHVNFINELSTPATAEARTLLGGYRGRLFF